MGDCDVVGWEGDDKISYTCNECGLTFCAEHRLPESHNCTGLRRSGSGTSQVLSTGLQNKTSQSAAKAGNTGNASSGRKLLWVAGYVIVLIIAGIYFAGFTPNGSTGVELSETPTLTETQEALPTTDSTTSGTSITSTTEQAENIFKQSFAGFTFATKELANETVEGWMNSPRHRENMLKEYWNREY